MHMWKHAAALALMAVVATGPTVSGDDKGKVSGDLKKLQGTWVNAAEGGQEVRWAFDGDKMKASVHGVDHSTKVVVEPKAEPHPTIDIEIVEGPDEVKGKKSLGIYKLDGDKLTVCVGMPGTDERPAEFKGVEDEAFLFELKRDKEQ